MAWRERIPPQHEDHEGAWAYDPAGAAVPRGSDHRITRGGVTAFQRLTTLEPAGVGAAELTPDEVPFLRFDAAAQERFCLPCLLAPSAPPVVPPAHLLSSGPGGAGATTTTATPTSLAPVGAAARADRGRSRALRPARSACLREIDARRPSGLFCYAGLEMTRGLALRLVLAALTMALIVWLFVACAAGRPTSQIRLREGYEVLTAHCEARAPESCTPVHVAGDPHDEEAWGFPGAAGGQRAVEGAGGPLRRGRPGAVRRGARGARHPERGVLGAGLLPMAVSAREPPQFP